ncbi:FAD-dependent oxidoreductase [Arthrobacter sp. Br18]|uniref:FAD-dependent oxidoreductase n=1 Tax=Arthrobacter sp. Br18 TaxID=1312954 RepID=UPI000478DDFB|nr:FAD-dependent oxidoreductase [Arthrobacter sp. Br18]
MTAPSRSTPERIVIVGFGPVAARLTEHLEPFVAAGLVQLTILGQEKDAAYNRVLVADVAVGRTPEEVLRLADTAALRSAGIDVRLGSTVQRIDRNIQQIHSDDGATVPYDRLVLATGSSPVLPPLAGADDAAALPAGVGFLRDLEDARALSAALAGGSRLVVLGGGLLGIEAALAAAEEGADVTLVHHGRHPLERLMGEGALLVGYALESAGIRLVSGAALGLELDDGRITGLAMGDGTVVPADALVIACGVRPRVQLAADALLETRDGVLVDHSLQVRGGDRIWAIGDCAEVRCTDPACAPCSIVTAPQGVIGPGWLQADQVGAAFAAGLTGAALGPAGTTPEPPRRRDAVVMLKACGFDAVAAGDTGVGLWDAGNGLDVAVWADSGHGQYVKMVTRDGVLTGLVCIGMPRTGAELVLLFERGGELPADRSSLLRLDTAETALAVGAPAGDSTLCRCAGIRRDVVEQSVAAGCATVGEVSSNTRAGSGCGGCHGDIRRIIEQHFAVAAVP